jgi:diacylglycerol kinase (ATP)
VEEPKINKQGRRGLAHIIDASRFSRKGLRAAYKYETAFRIELLLGAFLLPAAFWLGQNAVEYSLLIGAMLLVLMVEMINSAIEACVDRISVENHPLSGRAKDQGSAAVFLAVLLVILTWALVLLD